MTRTCPACPGVLHAASIGGVEREQCDACGGLWFDRAKLESALGRRLPAFGITAESDRTCPATNDALQTSQLDGLQVEWCAACGGMFLDAGELESLEQRAAAGAWQEKDTLDHVAEGVLWWGIFGGF